MIYAFERWSATVWSIDQWDVIEPESWTCLRRDMGVKRRALGWNSGADQCLRAKEEG